MINFDGFINKLNFKKAVKVFITLSVILIIFCISAITFVSKDKIHMALDYNKASEIFRKEGFSSNVKVQLNKLSSDSKDIINIIVLDSDNNIVFRANDSLLKGNTSLKFIPYERREGYLIDNINNDIIYRTVKEDNIILNEDYIRRDSDIENDIDSNMFYETDLNSKKVYLLNYVINRQNESKIFIVRTVNPIPYAENLIETTGTLFGLIFVFYWIGLALWVYKDAGKKHNNPSLWGLLVLITNLAGLIIYIMYKQTNRICSKCGALQSKENIYCINCGSKLNKQCSKCGEIINKNDNYCSRCGNKIQS